MNGLKVVSPIILAASLLFSLTQAAPAPRAVKARDYVTQIVTETVWTTVDITTTIYVDELPSNHVPATTSVEATSSAEVASSTQELESYLVSPAVTPTATPAAAAEALVSEPAPLESTSPEPTSAAVSAAVEESAESSTSPAPEYPAAVQPSSVPAPAYNTPTTALIPSPSPAESSPASQSAPAVDTTGTSGGSETGTCRGRSSSCKGDITHYDGGMSACGRIVNTKTEYVVALPFGFMGTRSNDNPYCNMPITVRNPVTGTTVRGIVGEKCMGCLRRSIDTTDIMFEAVTDGQGDGREYNFEWWLD